MKGKPVTTYQKGKKRYDFTYKNSKFAGRGWGDSINEAKRRVADRLGVSTRQLIVAK